MDKEATDHCMLCGIEFPKTGVYAEKTESGQHYRAEHHLIPKRFEKYHISQRSLAKKLNVGTQDFVPVYLCYECHEELLQNPVFTTEMIKELSHLIKGKSLEDKVVILSHVIELGIREAIKEEEIK
jgi:uncharacterized CHY-type Zn-finger protein